LRSSGFFDLDNQRVISRAEQARLSRRLPGRAAQGSLIGLIAVAWYWWQKNTIVGFWSAYSDDGNVLEFRNDGTFINYQSKTSTIAGHYDYNPIGRNLYLKVSGGRIPTGTVSVSIKRDIMVITMHDPIDNTVQLHRVDASKTNVLSFEEDLERKLNQRATPDTNLLQRFRR
jgi:hypothetical protein